MTLPLSAAVFNSNAVGQKLEEKEAFEGYSYELITGENVTEFYEDGELVWRRSDAEGSRIVEEGDLTVVTQYDEKGRPLSEFTYAENSAIEKRYEYSDDGILSQIITLKDGQIETLTIYNFSTLSLLSSVKVNGEQSYFSSSSYTFTDEGNVVIVDNYPNYQVRRGEEEVSYDDEGNLTVISGTRETRYRLDGQIASQIERNEEGEAILSIEWEYDDEGELVRISTTRGEEREVAIYEDGKEALIEFYRAGLLVRTRCDNEDGTIREIEMRYGKPFAAITYDVDGLRVLSLEIL